MKMIMKRKLTYCLLSVLLLMGGCGKDNDDSQLPLQAEFIFEFPENAEGWTGDFSDYPEGEEESYQLEFSYSNLPEPLDTDEGALKLSGNNHSDDLFMFIKKEISGLEPNREYNLNFSVEFASNVADDQAGIGGSPGESVYLKAGATSIEPEKQLEEDFYRMNMDKGNQSQSGDDMVVIGDFSNDTEENIYTLKTVTHSGFKATTNEEGSLWIIIGTDSGFEGNTTIYYNNVQVSLQ